MARFAVILLVLAAFVPAACGGENGGETVAIAGVDAFPDVLEIARAELGEAAALLGVTVKDNEIAFLNVQFGRSTNYRYSAAGVFTGRTSSTKPVKPSKTFSIAEVVANAPATMLAAIGEREDGSVQSFTATLARNESGSLEWRTRATVDGSAKEYTAAHDGTLAEG